jgi:hypothetical protein
MKSNLSVRSNLMVDNDKEPKYRYLPGDFIGQVYPDFLDSRIIEECLTECQLREYWQYLVCRLCRRPCAGTCENQR